MNRRCTRCGEDRPICDYNPRGNGVGLRSHCRVCRNAAAAVRRRADPARHRKNVNASYARHRAKRIAQTAEWNKSHPDRFRLNCRASHLRRKYGIGLDAYEALHKAQGGVCAICGQPETRMNYRTNEPYPLHVDHNHRTGRIRGLCCGSCNLALGHINDDPARARALADYIERKEGDYPTGRSA